MRAFATLSVAAAVFAAGSMLGGPASAAPIPVARYSFDGGLPDGAVTDDSGRGVTLRTVTQYGGTVRAVGGANGLGAEFPGRCGGSCPRAILEARDDNALDPGTRPIRYGASLLMRSEQTTEGSNVVQKGVWSTSSMWKLQVDGTAGRPSCVVKGSGSSRQYTARSALTVADGRWHQVTCERAGSALRIYVDGTERGKVSVPSSLSVSNGAPLRVGGAGLSTSSDRYHGAVDDVFVTVG